MQKTRLSAQETARLGDDIYERQIRPLVEADNYGKAVAVDVETGAYAIAETALVASHLLRASCPATEVWLVRVGHRALHRIRRARLHSAIP